MEEVQTKIVKGPIRSRYPWKSLTEVGMFFTIPADNIAGVTNARQLCYAANKAAEHKEKETRFKSFKQNDGSVVIRRIA